MSIRDKLLLDKTFPAVQILPDLLLDEGAAQEKVDRARQTANLVHLLRTALNAPG
jgi:hypothetical protein